MLQAIELQKDMKKQNVCNIGISIHQPYRPPTRLTPKQHFSRMRRKR